VVRLVGAGEASIGVTDSDDVAAGLRNNLPIAAVPIDSKFTDEFLRIPNTIAIVTGSAGENGAQEFYSFAQSETTLAALVAAKALDTMEPGNSIRISRPIEETTSIVGSIFKRQ
jgi:hypothetical protein